MPVNNRYNIEELIKACKDLNILYAIKNDQLEHAIKQLKDICNLQ